MNEHERSLWIGGLGACLLCCAAAAQAQEASNSAAPVIGPPQLRDFQLTPRERIVTQPAPAAQRPVEVAPPPPPVTAQPRDRQPARETPRSAPAAQPRPAAPAPVATAPAPTARTPEIPAAPLATPPPAPAAVEPESPAAVAPEPPAVPPGEGTAYWLYAIPAAALVLLGIAWLRRRRRSGEIAEAAATVTAPAKPRPEPVLRPWLEIELKTERASFTAEEAVVEFELSLNNTGKSAARNLRIDIKMFNAGREQDQAIGAFFKTAGRESTRLNLPGLGPASTGIIPGEVAMPREEMRAVRLDDKTLFIPVLAVNVLYDWGEGRTGQTSRSYVIGRELQEQGDKMGAFRVDQGPRIWRTVGQRQHSVAKRV